MFNWNMMGCEKISMGDQDLLLKDQEATGCPPDREQYAEDYLSGQLSENDKVAFEEHYFGCSDCFHAVQFREQYRSFIRDEAEKQLPELIREYGGNDSDSKSTAQEKASTTVLEMPDQSGGAGSGFAPYLRIAAMLVLISGFAWLWLSRQATEVPGESIEESPNFIVNSMLEKAISSEVRSGAHLTVYAPQNGEKVGGQLTFTWAANDSDKTLPELALIILDNQGNQVHETRVSGGQYRLDKELSPGLYYWELALPGAGFDTAKSLFLGKFLVVHPDM